MKNIGCLVIVIILLVNIIALSEQNRNLRKENDALMKEYKANLDPDSTTNAILLRQLNN